MVSNEYVRLNSPHDKYILYCDGRVKNTTTDRFLKLQMINSGYLIARLWGNNVETKELVHRLVAKYFIGNPNNYPVVNHIDGNRLNNHYSNLEWVTQESNLRSAQIAGQSSRSIHPFEIRHIGSGTITLYPDFKTALITIGVNPAKYVYNVKLREELKSGENKFIKIADTEYEIRLALDKLVGDYNWQ